MCLCAFAAPPWGAAAIKDCEARINRVILGHLNEAMSTCILIGWIVKPDAVIREVEKNGENFSRKGLYIVMIRYVAPVLICLILLASFGII